MEVKEEDELVSYTTKQLVDWHVISRRQYDQSLKWGGAGYEEVKSRCI